MTKKLASYVVFSGFLLFMPIFFAAAIDGGKEYVLAVKNSFPYNVVFSLEKYFINPETGEADGHFRFCDQWGNREKTVILSEGAYTLSIGKDKHLLSAVNLVVGNVKCEAFIKRGRTWGIPALNAGADVKKIYIDIGDSDLIISYEFEKPDK